MEIDLIIFSITLLIGLIGFLYNSYRERHDRNQRYSERAAIEKLTPLLTELHKLHNISLLYTFYPHLLMKQKQFYDSDTFRSIVTNALVFLEDKQLQESFLAIIVTLDQLNLLLKFESDQLLEEELKGAIRKFHEAIIPLNDGLGDLLFTKIGELPFKMNFKGSINSEETITAIRIAMNLIERAFQLESDDKTTELPKKVREKLKTIREKFSTEENN